jgi:hypothetical protein
MRRTITTFLGLTLILSAGVSAYAGSVDFTFDSQTINGTPITGLTAGATSAQIQTYMNSVLTASGCTGCSVTVLVNGSTIGAVADTTYNGEGHVTGPGNGATSLTLGNSNGATGSNSTSTLDSSSDTFIANTDNNSNQVSQQITLQFKGITGLSVNSFDYEIFPDGTCPVLNSSNCGGAQSGGHYPNQPDLDFEAGNNTNGTDAVVQTFYGVTPGGTNGTATHSPISGASNAELAPQAIGTWTGSLTGDTELDFVDWPATIGIDNLTIAGTNINPNISTPEPASIALLGTLVFFVARKFRRT